MGGMPEGFDPSQMMGGFSGGFPGQSSGEGSTDAGDSGSTASAQNSSRPSRDNMQMPDGNWNFSMNGGTGSAVSDGAAWMWILMSVLVLGAGLIIAKLYR